MRDAPGAAQVKKSPPTETALLLALAKHVEGAVIAAVPSRAKSPIESTMLGGEKHYQK